MNHHRYLALFGTLAAALLGSACEQKQETPAPPSYGAPAPAPIIVTPPPTPPTTVVTPPPATPPQVVVKVDDAALTARVKAALAAEEALRASKLNVITHDGAVTISGNVRNRDLQNTIVRVTEDIDGVTTVEVVPDS